MSRLPVAALALALAAPVFAAPTAPAAATVTATRAATAPRYRALEKMLRRFSRQPSSARAAFYAKR